MSEDILEIIKLDSEASMPTRTHPNDAGLDLYSLEDVYLSPQNGKLVRTGVAVAIPDGNVGLIFDRSSMAKKGFKTAGGVIDSGYRGEVQVVVWNLSQEELKITKKDRIAQLIVFPIRVPVVREVGVLSSSERGSKGFGSSGQ